jgi:hypothetical protein
MGRAMRGVNHDDRPCPHCDGANTGHCSAGKYEFYTTRVQQAGGAVALYACCAANRKRCPNFRAVQILRERGDGTVQLMSK